MSGCNFKFWSFGRCISNGGRDCGISQSQLLLQNDVILSLLLLCKLSLLPLSSTQHPSYIMPVDYACVMAGLA